jgi:uroporphyrinogen-III decarboxylase
VNSYERTMARLAGQPVDRPPNFDIMMQFAAHTIGQPLAKYYLDYRVLCAANFAVQEAFDLDILQAISDPYREAADCGQPVEFPDDALPLWRGPFLAEPDDLRKLKPPKPPICAG